MNKRILLSTIIILVLFVFVVPLTSALGVVPSSKKILLGEENSYQIKIQNNNKEAFTATLDVQGDLAKYITLSTNIIEFTPSKDSEIITVELNVQTESNLAQGNHENYIIIKQQIAGSSQIEATLNVASRLNFMIPYSDQALEIELYTPNFEKEKTNKFVIESKNVGELNIPGAIPVIEIYSSTNEKLETLQGQRINLNKGDKVLTDISWTPKVHNGKYYARAFVIYGDNTASTEKIFNVGSPEILIDTITSNDFKLGGIASLDLIISNTWVEAISDIYADVSLIKDSDIVYTTKTIDRDITSLGKTNLPIYLDTKGLEPRKYVLKIDLQYLGMNKEKSFDIYLNLDSLKISGFTGKVSSTPDEPVTSGTTILFIIVFILVFLNGIVVYKFVILKKKEEKNDTRK